jgi:short-subunit dehydrogenase involved in D-alanine esterification of teichoic acids
MLNYAGTPRPVATPETDSRQLIAADLRALIARIEISVRLIDAAMEQQDESGVVGVGDVFVLDDVTPRYATASAALNACRAGLGHALHCLSESGNPA